VNVTVAVLHQESALGPVAWQERQAHAKESPARPAREEGKTNKRWKRVMHVLLVALLVLTMFFLFPFNIINRTFAGNGMNTGYTVPAVPADVNAKPFFEFV
jgi:hypothetical protein